MNDKKRKIDTVYQLLPIEYISMYTGIFSDSKNNTTKSMYFRDWMSIKGYVFGLLLALSLVILSFNAFLSNKYNWLEIISISVIVSLVITMIITFKFYDKEFFIHYASWNEMMNSFPDFIDYENSNLDLKFQDKRKRIIIFLKWIKEFKS